MALKIYASADPDNAFSVDSDFDNPLRISLDGRVGGVSEVRYYLRNDDAAKTYSNITISVLDQTGRNITDGTNGYSWKLKAGDTQPLKEEWDTIEAANEISMADISNTTTYLPFWLRIEVPRGAAVEYFDAVKISIEYTESV